MFCNVLLIASSLPVSNEVISEVHKYCCMLILCALCDTLLEVFQHFKDRVSHHRDYRFVAGLQFLLRSSILVNYSFINYPEVMW